MPDNMPDHTSDKNGLQYIAELVHFRAVLLEMVKQQLILRYRRTVFGYLWTLINPLFMMAVTTLVFSNIFNLDFKDYGIFLFVGMVPFIFFSTSVTQSAHSFIINQSIIKQIYIPKIMFPLSNLITTFIDSIFLLIILFVIILIFKGDLYFSIIFVPISYILVFLFSFGVALFVSVSTVYFYDLQNLIAIFMQALIFLTPVFYKPDALSGRLSDLIALNPLTQFVELFRAPIDQGVFPSATTVLLASLFAFLSLAIGLWFFRQHEYRIIFRL